MIESRVIKMPGKKMFSVLFLNYGITWLIIALCGIILFVTLGLTDNIRFLIVALIWIFMIIPPMVVFLFFFYGMKPLTAFNTIPHTLSFDNDEVTVKITEPEEDLKDSQTKNKTYEVKNNLCSEVKTGADYVLLFFQKDGWLYVPVSGFDKIEDFRECVKGFVKNGN